jgi:hypothetical protein
MTEKDKAWLRKRFVDLEKRTTEQISRLRLQVEQLEQSLGLRKEGELRGAFELQNTETGEILERDEHKISTEGREWTLNLTKEQIEEQSKDLKHWAVFPAEEGDD